ncbi:MAG: Smr/MutS family protein [Bacteroidales bacterium]|nr:Smr/MutS family protein [Bacteroidales bacterium]
MIYPQNFEVKIGFDKIRLMLKESCLSSLGEKMVDGMQFQTNGEVVKDLLNQVNEMKTICQFEEAFPTDHFYDISKALIKIKNIGTYLELTDMFDFKRSYSTIKAIIAFFKSKEENKYPYLKKIGNDINLYPFIYDRLDQVLTKNGEIKDNASKDLQTIRRKIAEKQKSVSSKIHSILKRAKEQGIVEKDVSLAVRDGRVVIPVNYTDKRRISGFVHDESATGKTVYIEPAEVVEINNEIKELEYSERREIVKILVTFADDIRPYYDDILEAYEYLANMDFIRAKARLAMQLGASIPRITFESLINLKEAVHPLLYISHKRESKPVVPLDLSLNAQKRILLISGPNAGGKSVCLKTVGLLQYMFQCGLLVSASETSEMGMYSNIFIDIGDEQSIEDDLSTYSSHLVSMKHFIKNADAKTLILIDEFGTGTEPMLGGAIAEAILNKLNENQVMGVITTHYGNLKHFASSAEGITNAAMLYDAHQMEPLFKLEIGKPGSSFAFEIARKIGLPEDILHDASDKVGEEHIQFDKHLKDILRDKRYWENKRQKIRQTEKRLDEVLESYGEELENAKKLKKEILDSARAEAQEILSGANKQIENTIRVIKESQADKERTREARDKLNKVKQLVSSDVNGDERLEQKIKKIKDHQNRMKGADKDKQSKKESLISDSEIVAGDRVQIVGQDTIGEVIEVNGKSILVAFGNMITTLNERRLLKIKDEDDTKIRPYYKASKNSMNYNIGERKRNFKSEIDVRGKRAEEAITTIMEFIDEAIVVNASYLRILHGKGNGILRQVIRDYLYTVDVVKTCKDEHVERGGAGITIVELDI